MLLLWFLLPCILSQQFTSGIINTYSFSNSTTNNYTVKANLTNNTDFIISIGSYDSLLQLNSCQILQKKSTYVTVACTSNILSFYYLLYSRTPLIYSNIYTYSFFPSNTQRNVIWLAPINNNFIVYPQIRGLVTTLQLSNATVSHASILPLDNGTGLNISRSMNVLKIGFSFIIIQPSPPYYLKFEDVSVATNTYTQISQSFIFWGLQSIFVTQQLFSAFTISQAQNTYAICSNSAILGLIVIQQRSQLKCQNQFYVTSMQKCSSNCSDFSYSWNQPYFSSNYCLQSNQTATTNYISSNSIEIQQYSPFGCQQPNSTYLSTILCSTCDSAFLLNRGQCVCNYGQYMNNSGCFSCNQSSCSLNTQISVEILKEQLLNQTKINIVINLPQTYTYLQNCSQSYAINVTINNIIFGITANYNYTTNQIYMQIPQIPSSFSFKISFNSFSSDSLFLINKDNLTFFWKATADNLQVYLPFSTQSIIGALSPVFTNTDKTIPIILIIACLVGQKIQAFSIFQTTSIIYLAAFINFNSGYQDIASFITNIFIFQPTPFFQPIPTGSLAQQFSIDQSLIQYNSRVYQYNKGQFFFAFQANSILTLLIQISSILLSIYFLKRILLPSINKISPQNDNKKYRFNLIRSIVNSKAEIKWLSQPCLRSSASLRQKVYFEICLLWTKKYQIITSLIQLQVASYSFLIIYQFTLPIYNSYSLLSRIACAVIILAIVLYPSILINEQPIHVLKAVSTILKRKVYTHCQICIYFYCNYFEPIIYALLIVMLQNGIAQTLTLSILCLLKLIFMRKVLKKLQIIKQLCMASFFSCLFLTFILPQQLTNNLKQATIIFLLLILVCQLLKILKGFLVFILNIFKDKKQQSQIQNLKETQKITIQQQSKQPIFQSTTQLTSTPVINNNIRRSRRPRILKQINQQITSLRLKESSKQPSIFSN